MDNDYLRWDEVIEKPEYQNLSDSEKKTARYNYFKEVIKPQLKPHEVEDNWNAFTVDAVLIQKDYEDKIKQNKSELIDYNLTSFDNAHPLSKVHNKNTYDKNIPLDKEKTEEYQSYYNRLNNPESTLDQYKSSFLKGMDNSTLNRLAKQYSDGKTSMIDIPIEYEPQGLTQKVTQGLGTITGDLPLFLTGEKIVSSGLGLAGSGIKLLDAILKTGGSFALPEALSKIADIKDEKEYVDLDDLDDVLFEEAKGFLKGSLVGTAGQVSKAFTKGINNNVTRNLTDYVVGVPTETAALVGADSLIEGTPITKDSIAENLATIAVLKGLHLNPFSKKDITVNDSKNIEVKPDIVKSPSSIKETTKAIENKIKTEAEIRALMNNDIVDKIIDKQISLNYKTGKASEDILQINQIPTEYRSLLLDKTPDGGFKFKDDIINRINERTTIIPENEVKGEQVYDRYNKLREDYKDLRDEYKSIVNNPEAVKDKLYIEEVKNALNNNQENTIDLHTSSRGIAEQKYNALIEKYRNDLTSIVNEGKQIKELPEFTEYKNKVDNELLKTDEVKSQELKRQLEDLSNSYANQIFKSREHHNADLLSSLGEGVEYGDKSIRAEEVFGRDHINDLKDFFKVKDDDAVNILNNSNYLESHINKKFDFNNASRIVKNKLGEKVDKLFNKPLRQAEHNFVHELNLAKEYWKDIRKDFNVKEREEIGAHLLDQQGQARLTLQKMGVKAKSFEELTPKQQEAVKDIREKLDIVFSRINSARKIAGLESIERIDNYFTFLRKFSWAEELGYDPCTAPKEIFQSDIITDYPSKSFAFRFGKERVGSTREFELDAFYIMDKYLTSALRTAHMTPVIGRLRNILNKSEDFQLRNQNAYQFLSDSLDYISGKKISEAKDITNRLSNKLSRNLGVFILSYNFNSAVIQPTALVNTVAKLSPLYVGKGVRDFINPDMKKFAMNSSKVLKARMSDITIQEMTQGLYGKVGKIKEKTAEIGTLPLRYLDLKTAQVTWLSGYRYGKEFLKLSDKESILFADDIVINTQGSASRIDLAPVQRTPLGKAFTLFNTFVINNWNFLAEDISGVRKKNDLIKTNVKSKELLEYNDPSYLHVLVDKNNNLYDVYQKSKMLPTPEALDKVLTYVVATAMVNSVYELMGFNPPAPAPISSAYESLTGQSWIDTLKGNRPTKKEGQLIDAFLEAGKSLFQFVPVVGGAPRYGGNSMFGAVGNLFIETADSIAGKSGSKPLPYLIGKWSGIPGGQQIYKILKQLKKEEDERITNMKRQNNPVYYMNKEMKEANPEYYKQMDEVKKQMRGY